VLQSDWDGVVRFVPGWYTYAVEAHRGVLLAWRACPSGSIDVRSYRVDRLPPIGFSPPDTTAQDAVGVHALQALRLPHLSAGEHEGYASRQPISLDELLLLAHRPGQTDDSPAVAIYVWRPRSGRVTVLPQAWFTAESHDLGYDWITRVARDPRTGRIVGDGIRIPAFELDDDGLTVRAFFRG
jgi:hypothetical protein